MSHWGPAWCLSTHGDQFIPLCERPGSAPVDIRCCSGEKQGPVRRCGWGRWQGPHSWVYGALSPSHTISLIPHSHPVRGYYPCPHFQVKAAAPGHMFHICTPISQLLDLGLFSCQQKVKSKCQEHGQRLGVWESWEQLREVSVTLVSTPGTFSAQHRAWHRKLPLRHPAGEGMTQLQEQGGRLPQCPLSLDPPVFQASFSHWLPYTVPSAFRAFSQSPRMPQAPAHSRPLHLPLSLTASITFLVPWLFLTFSGRSSLYCCVSFRTFEPSATWHLPQPRSIMTWAVICSMHLSPTGCKLHDGSCHSLVTCLSSIVTRNKEWVTE